MSRQVNAGLCSFNTCVTQGLLFLDQNSHSSSQGNTGSRAINETGVGKDNNFLTFCCSILKRVGDTTQITVGH